MTPKCPTKAGDLLSVKVTFYLGGDIEDAVSEFMLIHVE
jgi:hypothetical protein